MTSARGELGKTSRHVPCLSVRLELCLFGSLHYYLFYSGCCLCESRAAIGTFPLAMLFYVLLLAHSSQRMTVLLPVSILTLPPPRNESSPTDVLDKAGGGSSESDKRQQGSLPQHRGSEGSGGSSPESSRQARAMARKVGSTAGN